MASSMDMSIPLLSAREKGREDRAHNASSSEVMVWVARNDDQIQEIGDPRSTRQSDRNWHQRKLRRATNTEND